MQKSHKDRTSTQEIRPVAQCVDARKSHFPCTDEARNKVVPKGSYAERDHTQKHHDCAMHGAELIIELRKHNPFGHAIRSKQAPQPWECLAGECQLPAHDKHE